MFAHKPPGLAMHSRLITPPLIEGQLGFVERHDVFNLFAVVLVTTVTRFEELNLGLCASHLHNNHAPECGTVTLLLEEGNDMARIKIASATVLSLCSLMSPPGYAQDTPLAFLCENIVGTYIGAPTWKANTDAMTGQQVLLHFKGRESNVNWYRFGKPYYERSGVGLTMKSGFVIIVLADDYLETYVFNAGTSELLFSMTRSGGSALSNAMKSQRGICKPAGEMVR